MAVAVVRIFGCLTANSLLATVTKDVTRCLHPSQMGVRSSERLRGHSPLHPTVAAVPRRRRRPMSLDCGPRKRSTRPTGPASRGNSRRLARDSDLCYSHDSFVLFGPAQATALVLFRFCLGWCQISHHARTVPPDSLLRTEDADLHYEVPGRDHQGIRIEPVLLTSSSSTKAIRTGLPYSTPHVAAPGCSSSARPTTTQRGTQAVPSMPELFVKPV